MITFTGLKVSASLMGNAQKRLQGAQEALDAKCIEVMEPYVPVANKKYKNHGKMSRSHKAEKPGVIINTEPRARREYYTNKGFSGLNRGKYWFERAKLDHRGDILKAAEEGLKK